MLVKASVAPGPPLPFAAPVLKLNVDWAQTSAVLTSEPMTMSRAVALRLTGVELNIFTVDDFSLLLSFSPGTFPRRKRSKPPTPRVDSSGANRGAAVANRGSYKEACDAFTGRGPGASGGGVWSEVDENSRRLRVPRVANRPR